MRYWRIITLVVMYSLFACTVQTKAYAYSPEIYGKQNLIAALHQLTQTAGRNAEIGIEIESMRSGEVLYSKNAQDLFTPASIMKILTAEAALLYLGSNYTFLTPWFISTRRPSRMVR